MIPCSNGRCIVVDKGTLILVPLNAISRDIALWGDDAHRFQPERWEESLKGSAIYPRTGGISFLIGPRACIGSTFGKRSTSLVLTPAQTEMKSFLSVLISSLEFTDDQRRIVPRRWIVSRPYDAGSRRDGCVLRVRALPSSAST